jgi:hypothetical protein
MAASHADPAAAPAGAAVPLFRRWYMLAILVALPFALYARSFGFALLEIDDSVYFLTNPTLHDGAAAGLHDLWTKPFFHDYSPITQLTIWLDRALSSSAVDFSGARIQQLLWLGLGTLALFQIARRLSGREDLAWVVALLYCLHPVVCESALWLGERKNLVSAALSWWAIERHIAWRQGAGRGALLGELALLPLALLAKPHAVIIPAVIAAYELILGTAGWRSRLCAVLPSALAAAAFLLVSLRVFGLYQGASQRLGGSLPAAVLCDGAILDRYLVHALLPYRLSFYYHVVEDLRRWPELLICWMLLAAAVAASIVVARQRRLVIFLWCAAIGSLLPVINLMPLPLPMSDHYLHWALPWLLLIAGLLVAERLCIPQGPDAAPRDPGQPRAQAPAPGWARPALLLGCGSVLFMLLTTAARIPDFRSAEAINHAATREQPDSAIAWGELCFLEATRPAPDFQQASEDGLIALRCDDARRIFLHALVNCAILGTMECQRREGVEAADRLLNRTLAVLTPGYPPFVRGMVLLLRGDDHGAVAVLEPLYTPMLRDAARALRPLCRAGTLQPWDLPPGPTFTHLGEDDLNTRADFNIEFQSLGTLARAYQGAGDLESAFDLAALLVNINPKYGAAVRIYRDICLQLGLQQAVARVDRELLAAGR